MPTATDTEPQNSDEASLKQRLDKIRRGMTKEEAKELLGKKQVQRVEKQRVAINALRKVTHRIYFDWEEVSNKFRGVPLYSPNHTAPSAPKWERELLGDDFFQNVAAVGFTSVKNGDADLKHLKDLYAITELHLWGPKFTNSGIDSILHLKRLTYLALDSTAITDKGVAKLKDLNALEELYLSGTSISGSGLSALQNLKHIQILDLTATNATDAAVPHILHNELLREIFLRKTRISNKGLQLLKKGLPHTHIDSD